MRRLLMLALLAVLIAFATQTAHAEYDWGTTSDEQDSYASWGRGDTAWTDQDGYGVVNKFDRTNRAPHRWYGSWERSGDAWTDQDGDGVVDRFDRNNRDPYRW